MRSLKSVKESTDESWDDKEINRYRIKYKIFIEYEKDTNSAIVQLKVSSYEKI